ncbi:MAG: hypothetical protein CMI18_10780 [Opitutaceae bacterium]|nr:hypothetical protein [Opitutaceae bacterium]|tara:strand:- start:1674 stop:2789 length:1116 start_codon:yes stop_codon:yes gene_type:complete
MSGDQETATPQSVEEIIDLIRSGSSLIPRGGKTKPTLSAANTKVSTVDMRSMSGIVEYLPSEYTITVKAGTTLQELIKALAENRQYLPFDPTMAEQGATIGGTVASGISGPGAYRYGPIKDFIIGVRFIDGEGNHVQGGGKVVKNAAGFDFPKLFNGSLGRMGIMTDLSFKVFPEPPSYATLEAKMDSFEDAITVLPKLKGFDLEGVEIDNHRILYLRLGYQKPTMASRKESLENLIGKPMKLTIGAREPETWSRFKAFDWSDPEGILIKTVIHTTSAVNVLKSLGNSNWKIHFSNGAKSIFLGGDASADPEEIDHILSQYSLPGLQLRGECIAHPLLGHHVSLPFIGRIQKALDPKKVFQPFPIKEALSA